jgi:hypothetical protein
VHSDCLVRAAAADGGAAAGEAACVELLGKCLKRLQAACLNSTLI